MTTGHHHRTIRLRSTSRLLRLLHTELATTTDLQRVDASRWVWGPHPDQHVGPDPTLYVLRPLGVLHALTGLTVDVTSPPEQPPPPYAVVCPYRCPWWVITGAGVAGDVGAVRYHMLTDHREA